MTSQSGIRRRSLLKGAGVACASIALPAFGQGLVFPKGPVRFVVPLNAGGAADVTTRPLAVELERTWKHPVVVDNRPGGLFMIGLQAILQAPADGHTLMYLYNSVATVQAVHKRFDLNRQLIPVTQTVGFPMVMLVSGNSPFKSVRDLVMFARDNPRKLRYSSLGPGSTEHLKALQIEKVAGFQAENISYKSGPDMVKGLIGGEVDFQLTAVTFAHAFAPKGQVRVLAVLENQRMKSMPEVPTLAEAGIEVTPFSYWSGYAVHADTPSQLVERLHKDLTAAAVAPFVRERLAPLGISPVVSNTPQDFRKLISDEVAWAAEYSKGLNFDKAS